MEPICSFVGSASAIYDREIFHFLRWKAALFIYSDFFNLENKLIKENIIAEGFDSLFIGDRIALPIYGQCHTGLISHTGVFLSSLIWPSISSHSSNSQQDASEFHPFSRLKHDLEFNIAWL